EKVATDVTYILLFRSFNWIDADKDENGTISNSEFCFGYRSSTIYDFSNSAKLEPSTGAE
ncbi:MAG: hypothetical protein KAJ29_05580, partial [Alphaproteobacteria bacterium]|nr:hypothetical protein [Alphaproteobacteria bacterium]